nr:TPA_asm: hypothetical protein [Phagomor virus 2]
MSNNLLTKKFSHTHPVSKLVPSTPLRQGEFYPIRSTALTGHRSKSTAGAYNGSATPVVHSTNNPPSKSLTKSPPHSNPLSLSAEQTARQLNEERKTLNLQHPQFPSDWTFNGSNPKRTHPRLIVDTSVFREIEINPPYLSKKGQLLSKIYTSIPFTSREQIVQYIEKQAHYGNFTQIYVVHLCIVRRLKAFMKYPHRVRYNQDDIIRYFTHHIERIIRLEKVDFYDASQAFTVQFGQYTCSPLPLPEFEFLKLDINNEEEFPSLTPKITTSPISPIPVKVSAVLPKLTFIQPSNLTTDTIDQTSTVIPREMLKPQSFSIPFKTPRTIKPIQVLQAVTPPVAAPRLSKIIDAPKVHSIPQLPDFVQTLEPHDLIDHKPQTQPPKVSYIKKLVTPNSNSLYAIDDNMKSYMKKLFPSNHQQRFKKYRRFLSQQEFKRLEALMPTEREKVASEEERIDGLFSIDYTIKFNDSKTPHVKSFLHKEYNLPKIYHNISPREFAKIIVIAHLRNDATLKQCAMNLLFTKKPQDRKLVLNFIKISDTFRKHKHVVLTSFLTCRYTPRQRHVIESFITSLSNFTFQSDDFEETSLNSLYMLVKNPHRLTRERFDYFFRTSWHVSAIIFRGLATSFTVPADVKELISFIPTIEALQDTMPNLFSSDVKTYHYQGLFDTLLGDSVDSAISALIEKFIPNLGPTIANMFITTVSALVTIFSDVPTHVRVLQIGVLISTIGASVSNKFVLSKLEKYLHYFTEKFASNGVVYQTGDSKVSGFVESISTVFHSLFISPKSKDSGINISILRIFTDTVNALKAAKSLKEMLSPIINYIKDYLDVLVHGQIEPSRFKHISKNLPDWLARADQILSYETVTTPMTTAHSRLSEYEKLVILARLVNEGNTFASIMATMPDVKPAFSAHFKNVLSKITTLATEKNAAMVGMHSKSEPFVIYLYGPAGVGKSVLVDVIAKNLFDLEDETYNPKIDKFQRAPNSIYWEGYMNQKVFVDDDFLQSKDIAYRNDVISTIISLGTRAPFPLNMAGLAGKGASHFNSELIMLTSNTDVVENIITTSIESMDAFSRRINMKVKISLINDSPAAVSEFRSSNSLSYKNVKFEFDDKTTNLEGFLLEAGLRRRAIIVKNRCLDFDLENNALIPELKAKFSELAPKAQELGKSVPITYVAGDKVKKSFKHQAGCTHCSTKNFDQCPEISFRFTQLFNQFRSNGISLQSFLQRAYLYKLACSDTNINPFAHLFNIHPAEVEVYYANRIFPFQHVNPLYENFAPQLVEKLEIIFTNNLFSNFLPFEEINIHSKFVFHPESDCDDDEFFCAIADNDFSCLKQKVSSKTLQYIEKVKDFFTKISNNPALIAAISILSIIGLTIPAVVGVKTYMKNKKAKDEVVVIEPKSVAFEGQLEHETPKYFAPMRNMQQFQPETPKYFDPFKGYNRFRPEDTEPRKRRGKKTAHGFESTRQEIIETLETAPDETSLPQQIQDDVVKLARRTDFVVQGCEDTKLRETIIAISSNLCYLVNDETHKGISGIFIAGTTCIFPSHLLYSPKKDDYDIECNLTITTPQIAGIRFQLNSSNCQIFPGKDLACIRLPLNIMSLRRDITKHFIQEENLVENYDRGLLFKYIPFTGKQFCFDSKFIDSITMNSEIIEPRFSGSTKCLTSIAKSYSYSGCTVAGDCGSVTIIHDPKKLQKIIGFHVAGQDSGCEGVSSLITQEFLKSLLTTEYQCEYPECLPCDKIEKFLIDDVEIVGVVPDRLQVRHATKTRIRMSKLFDRVFEHTTMPAAMNRNGNLDPLAIGVSKAFDQDIYIDEKYIKPALEATCNSILGRKSKYSTTGILSNDIIINGVPGDPCLKPMCMATSAGYPYNLWRGAKGKFHLLEGEVGNYSNKAEVQIIIDEFELALQNDILKAVIYVDTKKDERRPIQKVIDCKTRIFSVAPYHFNFLVRKYFLSFICHCMSQHVFGEVSVGLNAHSDEWGSCWNHLLTKGQNIIAGDYSGYDKKLPYQLCMEALEVVHRFYDDGEENKKIRTLLGVCMFSGFRMANKSIYRLAHGMPSGVPITAVFNSVVNSLIFRTTFVKLAETHLTSDYLNTVREMNSFFNFKSYGDDHLVAVCNSIPWFNMITVSDALAKWNIEYTTTTKKAVDQAYVPHDEVTYLKRKFVKRGGNWFAPLEMDSIRELINWVKTNDKDPLASLLDNVHCALLELTHYPKPIWEDFYCKLRNKAYRCSITLPAYTFEQCLAQQGTIQGFYVDFSETCTADLSDDPVVYQSGDHSDLAKSERHLKQKLQVFSNSHCVVSGDNQDAANSQENLTLLYRSHSLQECDDESFPVTGPLDEVDTHDELIRRFATKHLCEIAQLGKDSEPFCSICSSKTSATAMEKSLIDLHYELKAISGDFHKIEDWKTVLIRLREQISDCLKYPSLNKVYYFQSQDLVSPTETITNAVTALPHNQEGITNFRDTEPTANFVVAKVTPYDFTEVVSVPSIKAYVERPQELVTLQWSSASNGLIYQNVFPALLGQYVNLMGELNLFTGFSAGMKITVKMNGTALHYGRLAVSLQPLHNIANGSMAYMNSVSLLSFPTILISPSDTEPKSIEIPYISNMPFIPTNQVIVGTSDKWCTFRICIHVLNPLSAPPPVNNVSVSIYTQLTDTKFVGMTGRAPLTLIAPAALGTVGSIRMQDMFLKNAIFFQASDLTSTEANKKSRSGFSLSGVLSKVGNVMSIASFVPGIGVAAGVAGGVAALGAAVSRFFGYEKPISTDVTRKVFSRPPNPNFGKGLNVAEMMCFDPENKVGDFYDFMGSSVENLEIDFLKQRPGFIQRFTLSNASAANGLIGSLRVAPQLCLINIPDGAPVATTAVNILSTPLAHLSRLFMFWRGSMKFHVLVVASIFHSTRIRITYVPDATELYDPSTADNANYITEIMDVRGDAEIDFTVPWTTPLYYLPTTSGNSNGIIYFSVVNPLTCTVAPVPNIFINVWSSGAEDLTFYKPVGSNTLPNSLVYQSGEIVNKSAPTLGNGGSYTIKNFCFGEVVTNIKQLCQIANPVYVASSANGTDSHVLMDFNYKNWSNLTLPSHLTFIKNMFAFYRGGLTVWLEVFATKQSTSQMGGDTISVLLPGYYAAPLSTGFITGVTQLPEQIVGFPTITTKDGFAHMYLPWDSIAPFSANYTLNKTELRSALMFNVPGGTLARISLACADDFQLGFPIGMPALATTYANLLFTPAT